MLCNMLFLYLLQMLVAGRWILDEPESKIKDHTSRIQHQIFFGSGLSGLGATDKQ